MLHITGINMVADDVGNKFSWDTICHMLLWEVPTVLNQRSVDCANEFFTHYQFFQKLLSLETQTLPIIGQVQREGLILNEEKWEKEVSYHKELANIYQHRIDARGGSDAIYKELQDEIHLVRTFGHNLNRYSQRIKGVEGKIKLTGNWQHYRTNTGRYNCRQLPLMALPKEMWKCLSPLKAGYSYYSADLTNFELRVAAALTKCEAMQELFKQGVDVHSYNGDMFAQELHLGDLSAGDYHKIGKVVSFTLMYGGGEWRVLESIEEVIGRKINCNGPQHVKQLFMEQYPEFVSLLAPNNSQTLYTPFGSVPINIRLKRTQMINMPIQLCASILFKYIMIACFKYVKSAKIILPVHDELVFSAKDTDLQVFKREVKRVIESALNTGLSKLEVKNVVNVTLKGDF